MQTDTPSEYAIRRLLQNLDLLIVLDSPDNDYRFEYYTSPRKDGRTGEARLARTYRLIDLIRGAVTPEPWDTYDLDKQTTLVTNLMRFSHYRMTKVVSGWDVTCSVCGHMMHGKTWETVPKTCPNRDSNKCGAAIDEKQVVELLYSEHAT